jgi:serine/threonine protein kinase
MPPSPQDWLLIKDLFEAALEMDSARRSLFLNKRCQDPKLRIEVEKLLAANDKAGTFLSTPIIGSQPTRNSFLLSELGTTINRYQLQEELGTGGMGVVYKAFDPRENRLVAIKMIGQRNDIHATILGKTRRAANIAFNANRRMMLVREASLAARLHHPNIIRVFSYEQFRGLLYIVMEFLEGRSLDRVIAQDTGLPLEEKLRMSAQLLDGLSFAHSHGIMHRDVKPSNVFLCSDGMVKLLDFGLVATYSQAARGKATRAGTLRYMAPETFCGQVGHRADTWAAGVTIYELITGTSPFSAHTTSEVLHNILHMPCPKLPGTTQYSRQLNAIFERALNKDPLQRYDQVSEFAAHVKELFSSAAAFVAFSSDEPPPVNSMLYSTDDFNLQNMLAEREVSLETGRSSIKNYLGILDQLDYFDVVRPWFFTTIFAIMIMGLINATIPRAFEVVAANFALMAVGYVLIGGPKLALIPLAMVDFWTSIPRCRNCSHRMKTVYRNLRFAFSPVEIQYAIADCISALEEDLWDDAVKLFSIHTHEFAPSITNTVAGTALRYQLSFCQCLYCGQRCARLITDEKESEKWKSRPDYILAYKPWPLKDQSSSFRDKIATFLEHCREALMAGFSQTALPRALLIGLFALALFFIVGKLIILIFVNWSWAGLRPHFPRR